MYDLDCYVMQLLLMGANSDELKRIKCVVRCAVVMAYHLMLETSFLLDQTSMFSTISPSEVIDLALTDQKSTSVVINEATTFSEKPCDAEVKKSQNIISLSEGNSSLSFEACNPATFPGLSISTSIQRVMDDSFPLFSNSSPNKPAPLDIDEANQECQDKKTDVQISSVQEGENILNHELESSDTWDICDVTGDKTQSKDEINSVLDSESILVLMSSRNKSNGSICEHRHFSHIKFYRSFDVPLGKFLQDNLLNQVGGSPILKLPCTFCTAT